MDHIRVSRVLGTGIAALEAALEEIAMTVRAKFWVREIKHDVSGSTVTLNAVCRGKDNAEWASATPVGEVSMRVLSTAVDDWKPGDEFYLDFTPAPKGQEGMG